MVYGSLKYTMLDWAATNSSGKGLLGHDIVEVVHANSAIAVRVSPVNHLLQLLISHCLAELLGHSPEISQRDAARGVIIKEPEHFCYVLSSVLVAHSRRHHIEELLEIDTARFVFVQVGNHLENGRVLGLEAERLHGSSELLWIDGATAVRIE